MDLLEVTEKEKLLEEKQSQDNWQIVGICMAIGWVAYFTLSGSMVYALAACASLLTVPGIVALSARLFTRKWGIVFLVAWIIWFALGIVGLFTEKFYK